MCFLSWLAAHSNFATTLARLHHGAWATLSLKSNSLLCINLRCLTSTQMDILLGITGKDFVLLGTDTSCARSIVRLKADETKARILSPHSVLVVSGEGGDTTNFADYIQRNIRLYAIRHGLELQPSAAASFTRRQMADSLRTRVRLC
jgi:20S proteasome alpha/beta subunit